MELLQNEHLIKITNMLQEIGERIEGNLICDIYPNNWVINTNIDKIINLQHICKNKKKIIEIGVNAGHSLLIMLLTNPQAEYLLFDLNYHKYTSPIIEYLKLSFPNTKINIIYGDSVLTIKDYINNNPNEEKTYDMCHLDGGHTIDIFSCDYKNTKKLLNDDGVVIFDDYNYPDIFNFINNKILEKKIIVFNDDNKLKTTNLHCIFKYSKD